MYLIKYLFLSFSKFGLSRGMNKVLWLTVFNWVYNTTHSYMSWTYNLFLLCYFFFLYNSQCLPSTTVPMLCWRVADKIVLDTGTFRYHLSIHGRSFAIGPIRHVFTCIRGVTYEMLRYKRRYLSEVAECDAEECRQFRNCIPNVSRSCGKVAVTLQNMLKGCRIVGHIMLKCGGVKSQGIYTMLNYYFVISW